MAGTLRMARVIGDTYTFRTLFRKYGWEWNADAKAWEAVAEWRDEGHVRDDVRGMAGVGNRLRNYTVELVDLTPEEMAQYE